MRMECGFEALRASSDSAPIRNQEQQPGDASSSQTLGEGSSSGGTLLEAVMPFLRSNEGQQAPLQDIDQENIWENLAAREQEAGARKREEQLAAIEALEEAKVKMKEEEARMEEMKKLRNVEELRSNLEAHNKELGHIRALISDSQEKFFKSTEIHESIEREDAENSAYLERELSDLERWVDDVSLEHNRLLQKRDSLDQKLHKRIEGHYCKT